MKRWLITLTTLALVVLAGSSSALAEYQESPVQAVADKNVVLTLERIRERSPILRGMADKSDIGLAGAMYDVHTGQVTFM
jgi:carbonic anhydrase